MLYYEAPPDNQFDELKSRAIEIWSKMGDEPSYAQEKIGKIKDIKNVSDNFMYMVAMFDINNQRILSSQLTNETRKSVYERLKSGGLPNVYNVFN